MGLSDSVKDHIVVIVASTFAAGAGVSWVVAEKVRVEPLREEVGRLEKTVKDFKESAAEGKERSRNVEAQLETCRRSNSNVLAGGETGSTAASLPTSGAALLEHANRLSDQGKWREAKEAYTHYLDLNPENASAHGSLGICYMELGDFERALTEFDHVLEIVPGHWRATLDKADVLGFHLNRKSEARVLLSQLQEHNNPEARRLAIEIAEKLSK